MGCDDDDDDANDDDNDDDDDDDDDVAGKETDFQTDASIAGKVLHYRNEDD